MKVEKIIMSGSKTMWAIKLNDGKYLGQYFGEFGKTFPSWSTRYEAKVVLEYIKKHGIEKTLKKLEK